MLSATGVLSEDRLVSVIFQAIRQEPASPEDRWKAIMRAADVAKAYTYNGDGLMDKVFGSLDYSCSANEEKLPRTLRGAL